MNITQSRDESRPPQMALAAGVTGGDIEDDCAVPMKRSIKEQQQQRFDSAYVSGDIRSSADGSSISKSCHSEDPALASRWEWTELYPEAVRRNGDFLAYAIQEVKAFINALHRASILTSSDVTKRLDKNVFETIASKLEKHHKSVSSQNNVKTLFPSELPREYDVIVTFSELLRAHLDPLLLNAIYSGAVFDFAYTSVQSQSVQISIHLDIFVIHIHETNLCDVKSHTISSAEFRRVLVILAETMQSSSSELQKKLKLDYKIQAVILKPTGDSSLSCTLQFTSLKRVTRVLSDIQNGNISKLLKQYSQIYDSSTDWKLYVALSSGVGQHDVLLCFGGTHDASDDVKPLSFVKPQNKQLLVLCNLLQEYINDKSYSAFDLWERLRDARERRQFRAPNELRLEGGVPFLHMCFSAARYSLVQVIFHLGWFTSTANLKAPQTSPSVLRGKTAYDIAESMKLRKSLDEYNYYKSWDDSLSDVMRAARSGDKDKVLRLIPGSGKKLHYQDSNFGNALYWAVVNGNMDILRALLEKGGLDPTMRTRKRETLVHVAASLGQHHMIETLVTKCKIDPCLEDIHKKSPLDKVAENGDLKTLKAFLACDIRPTEKFVSLAAYNGRRPILEYCINELNLSMNTADAYGRTPLLRAAEAGHERVVSYLLDLGADIKAVTCTNRNVLHCAAESGKVNVVNRLLRELKKQKLLDQMLSSVDRFNGVECCFLIRGRDKGRDAWHYVEVKRHLVPLFLIRSRSGNVDVMQFGQILVSGWGANPDQDKIESIENEFKQRRLKTSQPADQTPLHMAIFKGHSEIALLLLRHGADVSKKDKFGLTPMMLAASKNLLDVIKDLEERGADVRATNRDGDTALKIAEENMHTESVNYLSGRGYGSAIERFLKTDVTRLINQLSKEKLDSLRNSGEDVQKHVVDTLREFRIDINETLVEIGSTPILKESSSS